jgi:hypothetical protein
MLKRFVGGALIAVTLTLSALWPKAAFARVSCGPFDDFSHWCICYIISQTGVITGWMRYQC